MQYVLKHAYIQDTRIEPKDAFQIDEDDVPF